jgi:hypothetical protein
MGDGAQFGVPIKCSVCAVVHSEAAGPTVVAYLGAGDRRDHAGRPVTLLWPVHRQCVRGEGRRYRQTGPDMLDPLAEHPNIPVRLRCPRCSQTTETSARAMLRRVREVGVFHLWLPLPRHAVIDFS